LRKNVDLDIRKDRACFADWDYTGNSQADFGNVVFWNNKLLACNFDFFCFDFLAAGIGFRE